MEKDIAAQIAALRTAPSMESMDSAATIETSPLYKYKVLMRYVMPVLRVKRLSSLDLVQQHLE